MSEEGIRAALYTAITTMICLLGRLRDAVAPVRPFRYDRTLPAPPHWSKRGFLVGCCDCGLDHFFVPEKSGTPRRPAKYSYRFRFGAVGWTQPDEVLGQEAKRALHRWLGNPLIIDQQGRPISDQRGKP